jgi:phenylpyruvate tautomerase PptA (4-oxalocrotonate tautomerase family)
MQGTQTKLANSFKTVVRPPQYDSLRSNTIAVALDRSPLPESAMPQDVDDFSSSFDGEVWTKVLSRRSVVHGFAVLGFAAATSPVGAFADQDSHQASSEQGHNTPAVPTTHENTCQENFDMPLVKIDAFEGRSHAEVKVLLDATHRAIVAGLGVPLRDRYQVYQAHSKAHLVIEDTGLGIPRTDNALIYTIFSKKRDEALKVKLYKELTKELQAAASIAPSDVMISIIENTGADWSFGNGVAQFLTGELK